MTVALFAVPRGRHQRRGPSERGEGARARARPQRGGRGRPEGLESALVGAWALCCHTWALRGHALLASVCRAREHNNSEYQY